MQNLPLYSGNFSREKTFKSFVVCGYLWKFSPWNLGAWCPLAQQKRAIHESFLCEIWGCGGLWHGKSEQSMKVFSVKIIFFTNSQKFSPSAIQYNLKLKSNNAQPVLECCTCACHTWQRLAKSGLYEICLLSMTTSRIWHTVVFLLVIVGSHSHTIWCATE